MIARSGLQRYLEAILDRRVRLLDVAPLATSGPGGDLKAFGWPL